MSWLLSRLEVGGLLACSDPGGAKACLALAELLRREGRPPALLVSNKHYDFYANWSQPVLVDPGWRLDQPYPWIFTGTSHPQSSGGFELRLLNQARARGISSHAFIDHWTSFLLRFQWGGQLFLPDQIWVLDERAQAMAREAGLPAELLAITENPYLEYIRRHWRPDPGVKLRLSDRLRANHFVLYVPDPVSLRPGGGLDFDEVSVLCELLQWLERTSEVGLLLKTHPLQDPRPVQAVLEQLTPALRDRCLWLETEDPLQLAALSRVVVGHYSNALLEADAVGAKVLRYFPGPRPPDYLEHAGVGLKLIDRAGLTAALNQSIT